MIDEFSVALIVLLTLVSAGGCTIVGPAPVLATLGRRRDDALEASVGPSSPVRQAVPYEGLQRTELHRDEQTAAATLIPASERVSAFVAPVGFDQVTGEHFGGQGAPQQSYVDWPEHAAVPVPVAAKPFALLPPTPINDGGSPADDVTYSSLLHEQVLGIASDHGEFYSGDGLRWLAASLGAGAVMANTGFDRHALRDTYLENIVLAPNDEFYEKLHQPKFLGDGHYTIPAFAIAALAEPLIDDLPLGSETAEWGQRSLRAILVGGPPMLGLQLLVGGSRPGENSSGSHWEPFQDDNGVSGHSFMGAIPFLSAAKMTENPWLRGAFYAASTLPALSRVNDDGHYFSQCFLGWWIAYVASTAVDRSHQPALNHHLFAYPQPGGVGLGFEYLH